MSNEISINSLSSNKNITIERILANPNINWGWYSITINSNITIDVIENNPGLEWDWRCMSRKSDLTIEFVLRHLDKPFDYNSISSHINITWEHVKQCPNLSWNYWYLSMNPNITLDIVLENPEARDYMHRTCNWQYLCQYNDITLNTVCKNIKYARGLIHDSHSRFKKFLLNMKLTQYELEDSHIKRIYREKR